MGMFDSLFGGAQNVGYQVSSLGSQIGVNTSGLNNALGQLGQVHSALQQVSALQDALKRFFGAIENSTLSKAFQLNGGGLTMDMREPVHYQHTVGGFADNITGTLGGIAGIMGQANSMIGQTQSIASQVESTRNTISNLGEGFG